MPVAPTLKVIANPYAAIDHQGRPCGAVLCDPIKHVRPVDAPNHPDPNQRFGRRTYVQVSVKKAEVKREGETVRVGDKVFREPDQHHHEWEFTKGSVELPYTDYYRRQIAEGSLICADKASWKLCDFDPRLFVDPMTVLAWAKEGAVANWIAAHGEDDARIATIATHWDGHVENTHPVAKALAADAKRASDAVVKADAPAAKPAPAAPAPTTPAAPAATPKGS